MRGRLRPARPLVLRRDWQNLAGEPPAEVHIAFVDGPNGEVIEFLKSDQL